MMFCVWKGAPRADGWIPQGEGDVLPALRWMTGDGFNRLDSPWLFFFCVFVLFFFIVLVRFCLLVGIGFLLVAVRFGSVRVGSGHFSFLFVGWFDSGYLGSNSFGSVLGVSSLVGLSIFSWTLFLFFLFLVVSLFIFTLSVFSLPPSIRSVTGGTRRGGWGN